MIVTRAAPQECASGATAKGIVSCAPVLADARNATAREHAGNAMGRAIVLAVWAGQPAEGRNAT